jgi:hypothetical protein
VAPTDASDRDGYKSPATNGDEFSNLAAACPYNGTHRNLDPYYGPDGNTDCDTNVHPNASAATDGCAYSHGYSTISCALNCLRAIPAGNRR